MRVAEQVLEVAACVTHALPFQYWSEEHAGGGFAALFRIGHAEVSARGGTRAWRPYICALRDFCARLLKRVYARGIRVGAYPRTQAVVVPHLLFLAGRRRRRRIRIGGRARRIAASVGRSFGAGPQGASLRHILCHARVKAIAALVHRMPATAVLGTLPFLRRRWR